jgi:hypothetical protein|nr:MAG TPA: hypothetical protein [Caudoviricetes sp.]
MVQKHAWYASNLVLRAVKLNVVVHQRLFFEIFISL